MQKFKAVGITTDMALQGSFLLPTSEELQNFNNEQGKKLMRVFI